MGGRDKGRRERFRDSLSLPCAGQDSVCQCAE